MGIDRDDLLRQAGLSTGDSITITSIDRSGRYRVTSQTFTDLHGIRSTEIPANSGGVDADSYQVILSFTKENIPTGGFDLQLQDNITNTAYTTETFDTGSYPDPALYGPVDVTDQIDTNGGIVIRSFWRSNTGNQNTILSPTYHLLAEL